MITVATRFCSLTAEVAGHAAAVGVAAVIMGAVWGITRGHKGRGHTTVIAPVPVTMRLRLKGNQRTHLMRHNNRYQQRRLQLTNRQPSGSGAPALTGFVGNFYWHAGFLKFIFSGLIGGRGIRC
jgi:hypothetical protein